MHMRRIHAAFDTSWSSVARPLRGTGALAAPGGRWRASMALALTALAVLATRGGAQTDYYNTDRGRPLRIEDAFPVERRAFEIQGAPLRLERSAGGAYAWSVEPELAWGILPRMHVEIGVPLSVTDAGAARRAGVGGIHLSSLYNFNVETAIPAFGVAAAALLPVGSQAPADPHVALTAIATRTLTWARFHVNASYTFGAAPPAGAPPADEDGEAERWAAGIAVDRTLPLRAALIGFEVLVQQPLHDADPRVLSVAGGVRHQVSPRWAVDAGLGARLTGNDRGWYATAGTAYAFGLPWRQ